eukprot:7104-Eustigmatos_ZCMA.PRE.1
MGLSNPVTRKLSPFVSYEERRVFLEYFFAAVYYKNDSQIISEPLNLPPRYNEYERGRALLGFNKSYTNKDTP